MVLPKEHGTWMMFFLPYLLGVFLSEPTIFHIPFLIGWFFLFLSSTPLLNIIRNRNVKADMMPWLVNYSVVAIIFLVPVLWMYPFLFVVGAFLLPLLGINIFFIKKLNERSLWNNLSGIITFALGGVATYIIGVGSLKYEAMFLLLFITVYFMGSAFYVKSLIRERKNLRFKRSSHIYHVLLLVIPWILGVPLLLFAYLPGVLKDWFTSRKKQMKPMKIGIIEIINGVVFFIISLVVMI
ncbi:YwiC-like family protein [Halalkalibacter lacteus]|uniref:YwiC-like family protein n=1 Tax=Halalkalibacter lacteus TaxID=3090663 RepID=UPI002FC671E0